MPQPFDIGEGQDAVDQPMESPEKDLAEPEMVDQPMPDEAANEFAEDQINEVIDVEAMQGDQLAPEIEALKDEVQDYLDQGLGIIEIIDQYVDDERINNIDGGPDMLAGRYGLIWRLKPELFDDEEAVGDVVDETVYPGLEHQPPVEDDAPVRAELPDEEMVDEHGNYYI